MKSRITAGIILIGVVLGGGWLTWHLWHRGSAAAEGDTAAEEAARDVVMLPAAKIEAAGIEVSPVARRRIEPTVVVPGRLQYDDTRHIEVKIPTDGVLAEIRVKPGDVVAAGQVLAVVSSPEVGNARADVLKRQAEHELAEEKLAWEDATAQGLQKLVAAIKDGGDAAAISRELEGVTLGSYREQIITAYARYRLAETLAAGVKSVQESGALSGRTVQERLSERDAADAALKAVSEQSAFEARQDCAAAKLAAEDAQRRLRISRQHLQALLGYEEAVADAKDDSSAARNDDHPLSLVELRAPFAGTIESRTFSVSERVRPGDALFVLADTSKLWVSADIREREWGALQLREGQELTVTLPALPDRRLTATVYYVGREVSPQTNAVPLVATIDNGDCQLRPGQFVRVRLPMAEPRDVLAVPDAAIVEHEGQAFAFVEQGAGKYARKDIQKGVADEGFTEVSGLKEGERIVVQGAFYLKSELLLEGEE
jgi:cobalt-zinc-cadmium efflux system membrane fusion protein